MFFKNTKTQRSTTRPTLSTEALEPRAMFSVAAMPVVETTVVDQFDVCPVNRAAEVNQVKTYCTGYCVAGGTGFIKLGDIKGDLRLTQNLGGTSGPGGTSFFRSVNSLAQANQQPNITGSAGPGGDDIFRPDPISRGLSLHDSVHCLVGDDGQMVIEPVFHGTEDVLAQANQMPNLIGDSDRPGDVGTSFEAGMNSGQDRQDVVLHASENPYESPNGFIKLGDIKGEFQLTQRLGGSAGPGGDDIFMPRPLNVSMYDHMQAPVENVSMYDHVKAPRYRAFALMGR
jgi:hypothetical protein